MEELRVQRLPLSTRAEAEHEKARFEEALGKTRTELLALASRLGDLIEGRQLIDAHILLVDDPILKRDVHRRISEGMLNAEYAVSQVLSEVIERFESMKDPYTRERSADVRDVGRRIINQLVGAEKEALMKLDMPVVIVARELDPSVTAGLRKDQVLGFATDEGGSTSHTAILARSLGIPAVVALREAAETVQPRQMVIVDGIHGRVIIDPEPDEILYYTELGKRYREAQAALARKSDTPVATSDGRPVELAANIEFSQEAEAAKNCGARGIGLFRTEFLRLLTPDADDEEVQYKAYSHVVKTLAPYPVIIRTLDLGGDKFLGTPGLHERNPFLGYRAIRICLDRPEIFKRQLRAIMRASADGDARLLIPLVSEVSQVVATRGLLAGISAELTSDGIPHNPHMPVGIMVETPAAAIGIDLFLPHVDFVSIGTNDLTQYTLAVDRGSPYVARLFDSMHPAVLRQIASVVQACHEAGKWAGVCGQMAAEPLSVPLLLGMGVDELSVSLSQIPDIREMIGIIDTSMARDLAGRALELPSASEVRSLVRTAIAGRFPGILIDGDGAGG